MNSKTLPVLARLAFLLGTLLVLAPSRVSATNIPTFPQRSPQTLLKPSDQWLLYQNAKYEYSIPYPSGWTVWEYSSEYARFLEHPMTPTGLGPISYISILVLGNPNQLPLAQWLSARGWNTQTMQTISIGNAQAMVATETGNVEGGSKTAYLQQADIVYQIALVVMEPDRKDMRQLYDSMLMSFRFSPIALGVFQPQRLAPIVPQPRAPTANYNRSAAYNYAQTHVYSINDDCKYLNCQSTPDCSSTNINCTNQADCVHFVSRALLAGGVGDGGQTWADTLHSWLLSSGAGSEVSSQTQLNVGDVIFYDWDSGPSLDHAAMVIANNGGGDVRIAEHSFQYPSGGPWQQWNAPWDNWGYHYVNATASYRFVAVGGGGGGSCPAPSLSSPSDGQTLNSRTVSFSWQGVSGCTFNGYTFRIKDTSNMDSGGTTIVDTGEGSTQHTETINGHDNQDLYWGVKAANAPNGASWSVRRFRIQPATSCSGPSLNSPSDGQTLSDRTVTFSWQAVSGCTFSGYTFRVKDTNNMDSGGTTIVDTGEGGTSHTETINGHDNQDLYWGVRAANAPDGASWSVRQFRIEPPSTPNPPTLVSPGDNAALNNRTVNFTWQSPNSPNQNGYTFRLSTSSNPDTQPWIVDTGLGNEYASYSYTFSADGTYYWHMRTWNTSGQASSWVSRSFVVDTVAPTGSITSPSDGAYFNSNSITVVATASDNNGGSGVQHVSFLSDYSGQWQDIGDDANGADGWSYVWDVSSVPDKMFNLYIFIFDRAGNWSGDGSWNITLDRTPPSSAVNALPASSPPAFTVTWSGTDALSGIASYDVQYQDGSSGAWTDWQTNVTSTSATFNGSGGHIYYFRSRTRDNAGNVEAWPTSADAQTTIFTLAPPTLISPADNAALNNRTMNFTWQSPNSPNQNGYTFRLSTSSNPDTQPWIVDTGLGNTYTSYTYTVSSDGTYYWHMRTWNTSGQASSWVSRSFVVDTGLPTAVFIRPVQDGYVNTNQVVVEVSPSDSQTSVTQVEFFAGYNNGTSWGWWDEFTDTNPSDGWIWTWNATNVSDQSMAFWVYVWDRAGNLGHTSIGNVRLDRTPPTSSVASLPAQSSSPFTVRWTGSDATAGIATYDVQYRDGSTGSWTDWRMNVSSTSATFIGLVGHTYYFRCRARDQAGNVETWRATPDAQTTVNQSNTYFYLPFIRK